MGPSKNPSALSKERLTELFDRIGMPAAGRRLVLRAMVAAPVRDVTSSGRNVVTFFHSRKAGAWIGTESRHVEFPAAVGFENDPNVLGYVPQPFTEAFEYHDPATGEIHVVRNTPDFLVIEIDGFTVVEGKPHAKLLKEAAKRPYLYKQAEDGTWYSPLLEAELGKLGLRYRIQTDLSFSKFWVENCLHLADYMGEAADPCPEEVLVQVRELLKHEGRMTLHELVNAPHNLSADHLLKAISDRALVANLNEEPLYDVRCAWLYRDETYCEFIRAQRDVHQPGKPSFVVDIAPGARFQYGAETLVVALTSDKQVVLNGESGNTMEVNRDWFIRAIEAEKFVPLEGAGGGKTRFQDYSEGQLAAALHRQSILEGTYFGAVPSDRTLSRFRARQAMARTSGANELLALSPMTHLRGNRTSRLDAAVVEKMDHVYVNDWRQSSAKNFRTCHNTLKALCSPNGLKVPSYPTFVSFIKRKISDADVRIRQSARYAYQQQAFVDTVEYEAPVHGTRPLQYVHIDHTEVDLECISARNGRRLGRPWLSIAVCATTRKIVALYLTYQPPSYRSVMMVIRDLVRRQGRLPEFIVVDNGSDLRSAAFAMFLEAMGCHLRFRPKGAPRHGAVLERLFGSANTEYIHNLTGNTKATKHVRMVTGKSLPSNNAEWTLEALYHGLCFWADEHYANAAHPALAESPSAAFTRLLRECGKRPQRLVLFNRDFLIATCPPADRRGERKLNHQTGVKVFERYFWHRSFRDVKVAGTMVQVRYDPFDASSVYVSVKGQWVQARCRRLAQLPPMSEAAWAAISEEYARKFKPMTNEAQEAQRLAEFVRTFTPQGAMEVHMERLDESEALAGFFGGGAITPFERVSSTPPRASAPAANAVVTHSRLPDDDFHEQSIDESQPAASEWVEPKLDDFESF